VTAATTSPAGDYAEALAVDLASGRLTGKRWANPGGPVVICIPGLSQDERSFDHIGPALARAGFDVAAIAPRGRGASDVTPEGTYGWPAHAADVAAIATALGADTFDVIGWSFGAFVGMQLAADVPARLRRLVLLDALGLPEESSLGPILAGLSRLGAIYDSVESYVESTLASGGMDGCRDDWTGYLEGDLVAVDGGWTTRTASVAVLEDSAHGRTRDPYELWAALTMPVLVVRAAKPILPGLGFIVSEADRDRFPTVVPDARVVDVDANHYCVGMLPATSTAIEEFLRA